MSGSAYSLPSKNGSNAGGERDPLLRGVVEETGEGEGGSEDPYDRDAVASAFTGVFNLANAAIGAGVLAFPFAFRLMGWIGAICLTAGVVCVMMWTQVLLFSLFVLSLFVDLCLCCVSPHLGCCVFEPLLVAFFRPLARSRFFPLLFCCRPPCRLLSERRLKSRAPPGTAF
jgi:Transmembrane amino acid transporter protein